MRPTTLRPGLFVAVLYARVSLDRDGRGASVDQQIAEGTANCADDEMPIFEVVRDDDISASEYSNRERKGYKSLPAVMTAAAKAYPGHRVVLVAWEDTRVSRRVSEVEEMITMCRKSGALLNYAGTMLDPEDLDVRYMLRVNGANSARDTDKTSKRVKRAARARANSGEPHARLPYGYRRQFDPHTGKSTGWVIDPERASIVQEIVRRILSGNESSGAILRDLNSRAIPAPGTSPETPGKNGWILGRMHLMIKSPTYAGYRTRDGEIVPGVAGQWEPLITEDEHRRLVAVLNDPRRRSTQQGPEPCHLLTGIAVCGVCGGTVKFAGYRTGAYTCPDPKKHATRVKTRVDGVVVAALIEFFGDPIRSRRAVFSDDTESSAAADEARQLRQRLDAVVDMFTTGTMSSESFMRAEATLGAQIKDAQRRSEQSTASPLLQRFAKCWEAIEIPERRAIAKEVWTSLDVREKRSVVRQCVDVTILPTGRVGGAPFDPDSVRVTMRFEAEPVFTPKA